MNLNGSFKRKKVYFSQVSNNALRDNGLSLKAKGLYALIQSYITIEGFILYKNYLGKQCSEGKSAFNTAWKELKEKGYLIQYKHSDKDGKFIYQYELLDKPLENSPHTDFPHLVNPPTGKSGSYSNTNPNNTDLNNKENIYLTLASHDNFISFYLKSHKDYLKKDHVRVTEEQLEFIDKSIDNLKVQDVTFEQWQESVIEHFENLPKKNNGNILAFLKASYRYFEVMPLD